jgi:cytochrome P450
MAPPPRPRAHPVLGSVRRSRIRRFYKHIAQACIGSHLAMLEATIAVALLLPLFRIRSEQERVPLDTHGITLRPNGAVPIQPARR